MTNYIVYREVTNPESGVTSRTMAGDFTYRADAAKLAKILNETIDELYHVAPRRRAVDMHIRS